MFYTTLPMPSLTPELLDNFPYSQYADPQSIQRGRAYFKDGRAWNVEIINDRKAICFVDGETGEYEVTIEVGKKSGALSLDCNCPYAEAHFCKHMIAAALAVSEYLKEEMFPWKIMMPLLFHLLHLPPAATGKANSRKLSPLHRANQRPI
ncbi:MAG: SWIM zinc finger family protein [Anaerolineales bacterium]|nr:SWIM zinc finger family protein [Anaerolineales bacterium]